MERKSNLQKKISKVKKQSARAVMDQKTSNSIKLVNKSPRLQEPEQKTQLNTYFQEYFVDLFSGAKIPVSAEYLEKCATEWLNLARDEEMLLMSEYHVRKGIHPATWEYWLKRSRPLQEARDLVRCIIAERRERGGLKNQYNPQWGLKMQHVYDKEWRDSEEWRANLAPKNEGLTSPIQVILEQFPDSPIVPQKKQIKEG